MQGVERKAAGLDFSGPTTQEYCQVSVEIESYTSQSVVKINVSYTCTGRNHARNSKNA